MLADLLQRHVDAGRVPGAAALVAHPGAEPEVAVAGRLTLGSDAPVRRDTLFRIASITKPILAAAAMTFVDDGTLRLDDSVSRWLPELADPVVVRTPQSPVDDVVPIDRPITVRDLLTFQLGYGWLAEFDLPAIQGYTTELAQGSAMSQDAPPPDEWMARLARMPLVYQPGESWLYNLGSEILGVLLARADGRSLPELFRERILDPVGMRDTGFQVPADQAHRLPTLYRPTDSGLEPADPPDGAWTRPVEFPSGAGGLVSTLDDWYAFAGMLLAEGEAGNRRVLTARSVRLMWTDTTTPAIRQQADLFLEGQGWGLGGSVDIVQTDPWTNLGRYGWVGGTGTAAYVVPSSGLVTILLTQVEMTGPSSTTLLQEFCSYAAQQPFSGRS